MENTDFYKELKSQFPAFNATLRLDERQQESLHGLLAYTEGALTSYRTKVAKADTICSQYNAQIREQKRSEALREAKAASIGAIENEFKKVQDRLVAAQTTLHNATRLPKPKDSIEALLRFQQQKENRDSLRELPVPDRIKILMDSVNTGNGSQLWAIENQPLASNLIPKDVLDGAAGTLAKKMAPGQVASVELAKADFEGATAVRNLAQIEIGHIERG